MHTQLHTVYTRVRTHTRLRQMSTLFPVDLPAPSSHPFTHTHTHTFQVPPPKRKPLLSHLSLSPSLWSCKGCVFIFLSFPLVSVSVSLELLLCLFFHHLPFFPGDAFSIPAHILTLYPTKPSISALQLRGTHASNALVRKNNYQVRGEGIQKEEDRPKACVVSAYKGLTQTGQA